MGMYDDLHLTGMTADAAKCAHGHSLSDFQTKSLECNLNSYYVHSGRLYLMTRNEGRRPFANARFEEIGKELKITYSSVCKSVDHTGEVLVHASCETCEPVYFENESGFMSGVDSRSPWCEFALFFKGGVLENVEPVRVESRDEVREKLLKAAQFPLPDDDRIVQRELRRWRAERG